MLNPTRTNAQACSQNCLAPSACYSEAPCLPVHGLDRLHIKWLCVQCTDHQLFFFSADRVWPLITRRTPPGIMHIFWPIDWSKFHLDHAGLTWPSTVCHPSRADGDGCDGCATPPGPGERSPAASWPPPADLLLRDGARRTASPRPTGLTLLCPLSSAVMSWYWAHSPDLDDPFL